MITTRELATHIYHRILEVADKKKSDPLHTVIDSHEISYIEHLICLHFEPDTHLGSKGFVSISSEKDNRSEYGC